MIRPYVSAVQAALRAFRATLRVSRRPSKPLLDPRVYLSANDLNNYLTKSAVITCTSDSRPSEPFEDMTIYETDTDRLLRWRAEGQWR